MGTSPARAQRGRFVGVTVLRLLMAALALALLLPRAALAKSYGITSVDIDATVAADGSLAVRETRRFSFDGSFNGVYWKIPTGSYEGREVTLALDEVGVLQGGQLVALERSDAETDGTYQLTEQEGYTQVKLYSAHADEDVDFVISYTYAGVASRWADTAELYWKFVSDGWDVPSQQVTCRIHLPVAAGAEVVPGESVRAWGHGARSGHVDFEGQDVVYTVPEVATQEFAEARVVFPGEWLGEVEPADEARLEGILDEEQRWADEANAERARMQGRRVRNCATMGILAVATSLYALLRKRRHTRLSRDAFDGEYYREMPSRDHPVVLASLLSFREKEDVEVIARLLAARGANGMPTSLMRLADEGVIMLDRMVDGFGRTQYRLTETGRVGRAHARDAADKASKAIDRATLALLFDVIGKHSGRPEAAAEAGRRAVLISDFETVARMNSSAYERGWAEWGKAVAAAYDERGFKTELDLTANIPLGLGILDFVVAGVMGFIAYLNGVSILVVLALAALLVAAGVWCIRVEVDTMYRHTPEAYDLMGKTEALKRWLLDFTRLKEAVPTDVALWNELLVMATALGISKEVLKQLRVKVPKIFDDPGFTAYGWYRRDPEEERNKRISPMDSFFKTMAAADAFVQPTHSYSSSSSDYDSSDYSSGRGSGGGFSSGGGGGFGGGGGGGAF